MAFGSIMSFMPASDLTTNIIDGVIAAAAVVALFFSIKTLKDSRETSTEARKQAASTVKLAESAAAQLNQQKRALAASIQPAVIDVGQDLLKLGTPGAAFDLDRDISVKEPVDPHGRKLILITVPVRNVGPGPAFINSTRVWVPREVITIDGKEVAAGDELDETNVTVAQRVLNAGETMHVILSAMPNTPGDEVLRRVIDVVPGASFMLYIRYTDLAGERRIRSELLIQSVESSPDGDPTKTDFRYMPMRIRLHECGPDWEPIGKPFVYSGGPQNEDVYVVTGRPLK
jgi:hypothetical protein